MSVYTLLNNQSAVQAAPGNAQVDALGRSLPPGSNLPTGSVMATLYGGAGEGSQASSSQGFQFNVTGTGAISATIQVIASNDGVNWFPYGAAQTVSGTTAATGAATGSAFVRYVSAYVTAISGTNAMADCLMAA